MRAILIALIQLYQRGAPSRLRRTCRFEPSCSNYAILALEKFGVIKGVYAAAHRILRCRRPNGGVDYP